MENFASKSLVGLSAIGSGDLQTITLLVAGHYDEELKCAFYYRKHFKAPDDASALNDEDVLASVERAKDFFRKGIQKLLDDCLENERLQSEAERKERFKKQNQPHEMGTVAEIAAKWKLSKAEVRRMKAAGTLESLLMLDEINKS